MNRWLVKSEPDSFSWAQQVANRIEPWTGVRNHEARRNLETMRIGDLAFFYHSNIGREIVGLVRVCREAYPDPTDATAGIATPWRCVDMEALAPVPRPVSLAAIRAEPRLSDLALLRRSRLSVVPVSSGHWDLLCAMGSVRTPRDPPGAGPAGLDQLTTGR
ncbi:MAG: EVE domain-containing protein [Gluconacetobacter diazotrophicus]|nr:EVE domain-containing protein [Gluconacetobacter diazotrophicus]